MEASFGKGGYIILSVIQFIYPFVAMVSYNVIVGDTITKLIVSITSYACSDQTFIVITKGCKIKFSVLQCTPRFYIDLSQFATRLSVKINLPNLFGTHVLI